MSEIRDIQTDADLEKALARVEEIFFADEGTSEERELEELTGKIRAYEVARFPREMPEPIEAIKFVMEQAGYEPTDLVSCIGSLADVQRVLAGDRPITLAIAERLHERLGIPLSLLWPEDEKAELAEPLQATLHAQQPNS